MSEVCCNKLIVRSRTIKLVFGRQGQRGVDGTDGSVPTWIAQTDAALVPGTPVYVKVSSNLGLAQADDIPQTRVRGLSLTTTAPSFAATIQAQGVVPLTTLEWDAITGDTGGLDAGQRYLLDPFTAGMLTKVGPIAGSGDYSAYVGTALNTTELDLDIRAPIQRS